jgi:hypothetical protein
MRQLGSSTSQFVRVRNGQPARGAMRFEKHDEHWIGPRVESRNRGRGLADVEHRGKLADLGQELY